MLPDRAFFFGFICNLIRITIFDEQIQSDMKIKTITNGNVLITGDNDVLIHKYSPKEEVYLEANSRFPNILYIYSKQGSIIQEIDSSKVIATSLNGTETAFSGTRADLYTLLTTSFFSSSSSGGATAAGQATGNNSLAAIDTKLGDLSKSEDAPHVSSDKGIMALGVRNDAETSLGADGDYEPLTTGPDGRLKVNLGLNQPAVRVKGDDANTATTTVISTIGAANSAIINTRGMSVVSLNAYGVATNLVLVLEGSNDSTNGTDGTWIGAVGYLLNNSATSGLSQFTLNPSTNGTAIKIDASGFTYIRARPTFITGASATVVLYSESFSNPLVYVANPIAIGAALPAGSNVIGTLGNPSALQSGYTTSHVAVLAATTNATSVKTTAALHGTITVSNGLPAAFWFKRYNKISAPTVGTDIPVEVILIPVGQTVSITKSYVGVKSSAGLAYAVTLGPELSNVSGLASANLAAVNIEYA